MYAIVDLGENQVKVEKGMVIPVALLDKEIDSEVVFDKVLLYSDGDDVKVGAPLVGDASVTVKVLAHKKADKVLVYKFKRRKNYKRKNGHRQQYTEVEVTGISCN